MAADILIGFRIACTLASSLHVTVELPFVRTRSLAIVENLVRGFK